MGALSLAIVALGEGFACGKDLACGEGTKSARSAAGDSGTEDSGTEDSGTEDSGTGVRAAKSRCNNSVAARL